MSDIFSTLESPATGRERAAALIAAVRGGDENAANELLGYIYPELKHRARWLMLNERAGHTFGASGSELVQRLLEQILEDDGMRLFQTAESEGKLLNLLTYRMRHILVDYARERGAQKRPQPSLRVSLDDSQLFWKPATTMDIETVLIVQEVLTKLVRMDPEAAKALELRFFSSFTNDEAACVMGLNVATFRRVLKRAMVFSKAALEAQTQKPALAHLGNSLSAMMTTVPAT